jgi:hypothetical protein
MMLTRLLLGLALAMAASILTATPAMVTAPHASADNCSQTKPPLDAASKQVDRGDMLWVSHTGAVGVTTPAGTGVVQVDNAGPIPLQALLIDAEQNAMRQLIVSNGRGAHLYLVSGCDITTVIDPQGAPFLFDLENLRGNGTGIGCLDIGAGPHLVGLQATLGPTGWTVRRTQIDFAGATATPGRSDTVPAASAQDPAVTQAQTISCRELTITKDGVQQP